MDSIIVNKITGRVEDNTCYISFYRSAVRVTTITNKELGISNLDCLTTELTSSQYCEYCKSVARVALIDKLVTSDDGLELEFDGSSDGKKKPTQKKTSQVFEEHTVALVEELIKDRDDLKIEYKIVDVQSAAKNGSIKSAECRVRITGQITLVAFIRSSQMTNLKEIRTDSGVRKFNKTNFNKILEV